MLLKEIFDPVYGMFKQSEETNMIWFSNNPFEDDIMYYMIGEKYIYTAAIKTMELSIQTRSAISSLDNGTRRVSIHRYYRWHLFVCMKKKPQNLYLYRPRNRLKEVFTCQNRSKAKSVVFVGNRSVFISFGFIWKMNIHNYNTENR